VGGILVFTVEALDTENNQKSHNSGIKSIQNSDYVNNDSNINYSLQSSGRIAHTYKYIKEISINSKFHILEISKATPRRDKGQPVRGYIVVLRK
jgi:predicted TPR repeat methyltransferase